MGGGGPVQSKIYCRFLTILYFRKVLKTKNCNITLSSLSAYLSIYELWKQNIFWRKDTSCFFSISSLRKIDSYSQAGLVRESRSRDQKKGFKFLNNYGFQMHIEPCLFSSKEKLLIYCFFYLPQKHRKSKLIKIVSQIERE